MGAGKYKHQTVNLAEAAWLVNTRGSNNWPGPDQANSLHTIEDKFPIVCVEKWLGKSAWVALPFRKGKPTCATVFTQGPGYILWVMCEDGEIWCVPQGDLTMGENNPWFEPYVIGSPKTGITSISGGRALQEAVQAQHLLDLSCL